MTRVFSNSSILIDKLCCRAELIVRVSRLAATSRMMGRANSSIGSSSSDNLEIEPEGEGTLEGEVNVDISGPSPRLSAGVLRPSLARDWGSANPTARYPGRAGLLGAGLCER